MFVGSSRNKLGLASAVFLKGLQYFLDKRPEKQAKKKQGCQICREKNSPLAENPGIPGGERVYHRNAQSAVRHRNQAGGNIAAAALGVFHGELLVIEQASVRSGGFCIDPVVSQGFFLQPDPEGLPVRHPWREIGKTEGCRCL